MGLLNVLQAKWDGKVGQTVGAKWKNKATIRAYAKPANPNTASQQSIREIFKDATSFIALFSDQLKGKTSLNVRSQSIRNAIIQANKDQFVVGGAFDPKTLVVNKGGLSQPEGFRWDNNTGIIEWTPPTATNISAKAKVIVIAVNATEKRALVGESLASSGECIVPVLGTTYEAIYAYMLDYRGSTRVGSLSKQFVT